jgi:hypothetical protein
MLPIPPFLSLNGLRLENQSCPRKAPSLLGNLLDFSVFWASFHAAILYFRHQHFSSLDYYLGGQPTHLVLLGNLSYPTHRLGCAANLSHRIQDIVYS